MLFVPRCSVDVGDTWTRECMAYEHVVVNDGYLGKNTSLWTMMFLCKRVLAVIAFTLQVLVDKRCVKDRSFTKTGSCCTLGLWLCSARFYGVGSTKYILSFTMMTYTCLTSSCMVLSYTYSMWHINIICIPFRGYTRDIHYTHNLIQIIYDVDIIYNHLL